MNTKFEIGDKVEITFDYMLYYSKEQHGHESRIYFGTITEIIGTASRPLYCIEGFLLKFFYEDLEKIN